MAGTKYGAIMAGVTRRLRKLGVTNAVIEAATKPKRAPAVRLTAENRQRIRELLINKGDKCVLLLSSHGKVRVVSLDGLSRMVENGKALHATPSQAQPA